MIPAFPDMDRLRNILALLLVILPTAVHAVDFEWHGFGTIGLAGFNNDAVNTGTNIPYSMHTSNIEDFDTRLAVQGTAHFNDKFSSTVQLIARGVDDYKVEVEWAYMTWQPLDNLKFRVGKLRKPLFVLSDFYDVGYAYDWVRPPSPTYFEFGPFFSTIDSIDLYHQGSLRDWSYSVQTYIGQRTSDEQFGDLNYGYQETRTFGAVFSLEKENTALRLGLHESRFNMIFRELNDLIAILDGLGYDTLGDNISIIDKKTPFLAFGLSHTWDNWSFNAEIINARPEKTIAPNIDAWYASLGRRFGPVLIHTTIGEQNSRKNVAYLAPINAAAEAELTSGNADSAQRAAQLNAVYGALNELLDTTVARRRSIGTGLRYDFLDNAALKLDYQYIENLLGGNSSLYSVTLDFLF